MRGRAITDFIVTEGPMPNVPHHVSSPAGASVKAQRSNEGVCRADFLTHADGFPLVEDLLYIVETALLDLPNAVITSHCRCPAIPPSVLRKSVGTRRIRGIGESVLRLPPDFSPKPLAGQPLAIIKLRLICKTSARDVRACPDPAKQRSGERQCG
jgi:hypothetical protein